MATTMDLWIVAIVVTYEPTVSRLDQVLQHLSNQVDGIVIVDNTAGPAGGLGSVNFPKSVSCFFRVITLGDNLGIAKAQNIGINEALLSDASHVLLMDQDSIPAAGMVRELINAHSMLDVEGIPVGCVCPAYFDEGTGKAVNFQVQRPDRLFYSTVSANSEAAWIEIIVSISSGSLISRHALDAVGKMREDFFIDHVDTEWCHRARSLGRRNFGVPRARLVHRLGGFSFRVWFFGWKSKGNYPPVRLYYGFRNFVRMVFIPHVPRAWLLRAGIYMLGNYCYVYAVFSPRRRESFLAMMRGLWDGIQKKGGRSSHG